MTARRVVDVFASPRRVALLGVSSDPTSITARPALYASRFGTDAEVTIVKRSGPAQLHGLPVQGSLAELSEVPDVAMVLIPAGGVVGALRDCAEAGVAGAVVIASGFEDGDGVARRREVARLLADHPGFRLIGPNCVGVTSPAGRSWLTFSSVLQQGPAISGSVGLVTQSGAVGNGLLLALQRRGVGVGHWFSTGDELDVGALEVTTELLARDDCRAVGLFLEGITDQDHRLRLAEAIAASGKRVVALRAASSEQGKRAAMGHTGRVIGRDEVARAALEEIGVVLVDSLDELTAALTVCSVTPPRPSMSDPASITVITVSGATGVLAADEVAAQPGLRLIELDADARADVADTAGTIDADHVTNPIDLPVLGDPSVFERTIARLATAGEADATVAIVSTLAHDYASMSHNLASDGRPLVLAHLSPAEDFDADQARRLAERGVAVVRGPRDAIRALAVWAGVADDAAAADGGVAGVADDADRHPAGTWQDGVIGSAAAMHGALDQWLVTGELVADADEAVAFLEQHHDHGIVLKADGAQIAHRADVGAVVPGLRAPDQVREAFTRVAKVCADEGDRVLAQAMAPPGIEVMVSVLRDPEVGVAALLRPGGVLVEAGGDTVVLTELVAGWARALDASVLGSMLAGWRGAPPADRAALLDLLEQLVAQVTADEDLELVECNPVLVHPVSTGQGATVVDLLTYRRAERADS